MTGHQWVGAALVGMGVGETRRAEHAARTGRHILPAATKIKVLEVYCVNCRVHYDVRTQDQGCPAALPRSA